MPKDVAQICAVKEIHIFRIHKVNKLNPQPINGGGTNGKKMALAGAIIVIFIIIGLVVPHNRVNLGT